LGSLALGCRSLAPSSWLSALGQNLYAVILSEAKDLCIGISLRPLRIFFAFSAVKSFAAESIKLMRPL
ncbi:MAG TPA: hypothetical protein VGU90_01790, partial [Terriglobales bacterium]|nr:hypothetical protein [Terriglobales bacterium]